MSDSLPINANWPSDRPVTAYDAPEAPGEGQTWIAILLWVPGLLVASGLFLAGQTPLGLILLAAVALIHIILAPAAAIYLLILTIPLEVLVSVIPNVTTLPKVMGVVALVASLGSLSRALTNGRWDSCAKWILLLIAWGGLSVLWAKHTDLALLALQSLVLVWAIPLLIAVRITTRKQWRLALIILIFSCLCNGTALLSGHTSVGAVVSGKARGSTTTLIGSEDASDANGAARLAAVAIVGCLVFLFSSRGLLRKALSIAAVALLAISIVLFMARNVYLGLPACLLGGMLLVRGAGIGKRVVMVIGIVLVGAIVVMVFLKLGLLGRGIEERFSSIFKEGSTSGHRYLLWQGHIHHFFNTGMAGLGIMQVRYTPESLYMVAHNDVCDIAGNLGLPGLIGFLGFHVALFRRLRKMRDLWMGLFCVTAWLLLLFGGLTETDYRHKGYALVAGLIIAGLRIEERERNSLVSSASYPGGLPGYPV